jgi:hypothetical protein
MCVTVVLLPVISVAASCTAHDIFRGFIYSCGIYLLCVQMLAVVAKISSDPHKLSLSKATTKDHKVSGARNNDGATHFQASAHKHKFRGDGKVRN